MTYNQKRHIELLKCSQELRNQGKNLFIENPEENLELCRYNVVMEEHIFRQNRYEVKLFMEDFLNRKINGEELCSRVYGHRNKLRDRCEKFELELISGSEKIKAFHLEERSKKFSGILTGLFCDCDDFDDDYENDEFYTSIKNRFLNFQKDLNEDLNQD